MIIVSIVVGIVCGVIIYNIYLSKGYSNQEALAFGIGLGLIGGVIGLIFALFAKQKKEPADTNSQSSQASYTPVPVETPEMKMEREKRNQEEREKLALKREKELLERGGWRCVCGNVNAYYVTACSCGVTREDAEAKCEKGETAAK